MNFKKMMAISLVLATTFSYSPKSHSLVGTAAWNPPLIGIGFLLYSGAAVVGGVAAEGAKLAFDNPNYPIYIKVAGVVSGAIAIVGVVGTFVGFAVLPDGSQTIVYSPVTSKLQKELKLSESEAMSFNNELDQVNFVTEQVAMDLSRIAAPTAEDSKIIWSRYADLLSPKTQSALIKVSKSMFQ